MNNRKSLIFVLPLIALVLMACRVGNVSVSARNVRGSGNVVSEERSVRDVERVSLSSIGDLKIIQGDEEGLTIQAEDNILELIETEMRGRELVIGMKNGVSVDPTEPIVYTLKVKTLSRVSVSGAGNVDAETLNVNDLELVVSGTGNMTVDQLQAEDLTARTSGAGNFDISGTVRTVSVSISGAGNFEGGDLQSEKADVSISGSGNVTVWAADTLEVRVSGFGVVNYYGRPNVSQTITGGGEIKNLGSK